MRKIPLTRVAFARRPTQNVTMSFPTPPQRVPAPTLACALLVTALALVLPGLADASTTHGPKVEPSLSLVVDRAIARGSTAPLHVIVFGSNLAGVNQAVGIQTRNDLDLVGGESVSIAPSKIDQVAAQAGVAFVVLDRSMAATAGIPPARTPFNAPALSTFYPAIDKAPGAWAQGVTGAGIGIAVIDSGVTPRADFGDRLVRVTMPTQDGTKLDDGFGHGSLVAGIAAGQSPDGRYVGVAPGATVYAVNIARDDGVYTSDVIAGLRWVYLHRSETNVRVVNLSLTQTAPSQYTSSTLDAAVERLWKAGIVVVVSAGNLGPDSSLYAPGNDPFAITVGASDPNDTADPADDTLAPWSSYGETQAGYAKPELVAPGRHIVSTVPGLSTLARVAPPENMVANGYLRINGTSFSAPQVAGAAALLLQQKPTLTPDQVKWVLMRAARSLEGSDAGALDLASTASLLALPGSANVGVPYSTWATVGASTNAFIGGLSLTDRAAAWEKAAVVMERAAQQASDLAAKATPSQRRLLWGRAADAWTKASAAWDNAADSWADAGVVEKAAAASLSAGNDWKKTGDAWNNALLPDKASAAWDKASAAWDAATEWSKASAAWDKGAAWDDGAWDASAAWE
ncbi:MAG: serine protease AprX [Gaiellaceae bacterium]|nr:serine protease AprX [Gaiellaceae bacterium]